MRRLSAHCFTAAMLLVLGACGKADSRADPVQSASDEKPASLALVGYNYTNRYIDSFSVDGQGGGNVYVSSPASGGGGTVCCVEYRLGITRNTVTVRWQSGACYYRVRSRTSNEVFVRLHPFFKEQEVTVAGNVAAKAAYMEVHFYPDGSVQAAVTLQQSTPRVSLSKEREDKSRYPRCPNDEKPSA